MSGIVTAFVHESTIGTTPATPAMLEAPVLSHDVNATPSFLRSRTQRADGFRAAGRQGRVNIGGPMEMELSLEAAIVNNLGLLHALCGNAPVDDTAGGAGEHVIDLGKTNIGLTLERQRVTHPTAAQRYQVFTGCMLNEAAFDINADNLVTARFGVLGLTHGGKSDTPLDTPITAVTGKSPFSAADASVKYWDGTAWTALSDVTGIRFTINRNRSVIGVVGSKDNRGPFDSGISVEGEMQVFPEQTDADFWTSFVNETALELQFRFNDVNGTDWLEIEMPGFSPIEYNENPPVEGPESAVIVFEAKPATIRTTPVVAVPLRFRSNLDLLP